MSAGVTDRGSVVNPSSSDTTTAVSAFTPGANRLLLAYVLLAGATGLEASGITGHGTWSLIRRDAMSGGSLLSNYELWGCITGGSPSSAAVEVTHNSYIDVGFMVVECSADYGDTTVAASIIQDAETGGYYTAAPNVVVTLSSFADSSNMCVMFSGAYNADGNPSTTFTPQGSLTTDATIIDTPEFTAMHCCSYEGEDTTPQVNMTDTYADYGCMAVEVKAAGGSVTVTDVNTTETWTDGDTGLVATGTGFVS